MASETVENYLKAIMTLAAESPDREATISRIAAMVGVTRGSATSMVKKLSAAKLVKAERYGGVMLTARGSRAAADVLRRHRLIETFLVRTLKFDWAEVHDEAERLEHAVSPRLLARLDEFLGHPESDPHGDPIPGPAGAHFETSGKRLSDCAAATDVRILRVIDQSAEFLRFMADHGLVPEARVTVVAVHPAAQSIEVEPRGRARLVLAFAAAEKIMVAAAPRRRRCAAKRGSGVTMGPGTASWILALVLAGSDATEVVDPTTPETPATPEAPDASESQPDTDAEHAAAGHRLAVDAAPHAAYTQSRRSAEIEASFGLAGDLWGVRRTLADFGIDFGAQLTLDNAWNVTGGTSTGSMFMSLLDVNFAVRTEPLLEWKGGRFYISMLSYAQSRESYELVGDFWGWDAINSGVGSVTQLAELWYEQEFLDKLLTLRFGKQDANSSFAAVPGAGSFISSASTYPGTIVWYLPTYARQATGVDLVVQPTDWLTGRVGWFDGSSNYYDAERGSVWPNTGTRGPKSFFDNPGSWFFITELDAKWTLADTSLPGSAQIGYWWQTGPVAFDVSTVPGFTGASSVYVTDGSEGLYLGASQAIFSFAGDERASRRVSLFSQLGFGSGASNPATFSLISGLTATGVIPGRDSDQCGVQFNYVRFSNDDRVWPYPGTDQLALELFYRVQVTPAFAVQPDVQWIRHPNGQPGVDDALLLTLRVQLAF